MTQMNVGKLLVIYVDGGPKVAVRYSKYVLKTGDGLNDDETHWASMSITIRRFLGLCVYKDGIKRISQNNDIFHIYECLNFHFSPKKTSLMSIIIHWKFLSSGTKTILTHIT